MTDLSIALADGACLVDSSRSVASVDLKAVLIDRLTRYYARLGSGGVSDLSSLEEIQLVTAKEALSVVMRVQHVLSTDKEAAGAAAASDGSQQVPLIGTRDLTELRTLLSIVFKWGVEPLLAKVVLACSRKASIEGLPRIIDLTTTSEDYKLLSSTICDLLNLVFPGGVQGRIAQTLITTTIIQLHATDLLRPCLTLGWLPKSLSSTSRPTLDIARPLTMRFLTLLSPSQAITALGGVLSSVPPVSPYVRKPCVSLLSQQLLRPQGVRGLCAAVFGEDQMSIDDAPIEKLQHIAHVLTTVPANMKPQEYFDTVVPRIIDLLSSQSPWTYKRAAAYTIARMLSTDDSFPHQELTSRITFSLLHGPFFADPEEETNPELLSSSASSPSRPDSFTALSKLITLVSNMDPSPELISSLLTPIISTLYSLLYYMDKIKTTDPNLKESLRGIMITWAKIVGTSEGIDTLWSILRSDEGGWKVNLEGQIHKVKKSDHSSRLSLLTPEDLRENELHDIDMDANILDLYPDPVHFVRFIKDIDRADISSELFVKLLEAYRGSKEEDNPLRTLLYLQIIMQMQMHMSEGKSSSNILDKPMHLLSFIKHVLEPTSASAETKGKQRTTSALGGLHLNDAPDQGLLDEGDSDDDTPGSEIITAEGEMIETSLNLLLSILEAHPNLSARTAPVLNDIFSLLETLARNGSPSVGPLAREARMVMTARLASTSSLGMSSRAEEEETAQDIYQKALKLLQDPILPVRAHGLLLLRQLVTPSTRKDSKAPVLSDRALVPAILSIFLQSVQDDDSYIFLNAVQGLAAMVDTFGKDVLSGLINEYVGGLDGLGAATTLSQRDLDIRVRVGEALGSVIRRCGEALGIYVDIILPPLFNIVRKRDVPTALRTSALSLLGECESTTPLAVLPYVTDLADAVIDLLQIETVPAKTTSASEEKNEGLPPTMDSEPTSTNPKFPPLRRAALHFLSLLIRETTKQIYDSSFGRSLFSDTFMKRAKITLSYVASTDEDLVVRVMAREAGEGLDEMRRAMMGI